MSIIGGRGNATHPLLTLPLPSPTHMFRQGSCSCHLCTAITARHKLSHPIAAAHIEQ